MTELRFTVASGDSSDTVAVPVAAVFNFGYAGRDQEAVRAHVAELASRGIAAPATVPTLYGIPRDRVTTATAIEVVGHDTYAEVEYALALAPGGRWLVAVASDHTDTIVEEADMARGKGMAPDVLSPAAWWLDELGGRFDELVLSCERLDGGAPTVTQRAPLSSLLEPAALLETLRRRLGPDPAPGTVVLSGTIDGHPEAGARRWRIALEDVAGGRRIEHTYAVEPIEPELREPGG